MLLTAALAFGAVVGLLVLVLGGNFTVELLDGDSPNEAWRDTRALGVALLAAFGALVATGVVELAGLIDMGANLLGSSPIALTNLFSIGLGWLGISGRIDVGPVLFVGAAGAFLALALVAREVKNG